ncbi:hypothetical protein ACSYAY_00875 [Leptospirillum ferriphilum]|uniref:Uncharacterized protein n=1 Tax=Leptospirillum ferriphilum TaxID=178606 RepID=A0A1V3SVI6_9BACT|nr:hypothetical protein [Leptospirillum ferriphilum]OOH72839.1 hypothetical protein BOX24_05475 [Leptospirillum ferriphilum]
MLTIRPTNLGSPIGGLTIRRVEVVDVSDPKSEKVIEVYFDVVNILGIVLEKFKTEEAARIYIEKQRLLNQSPRVRS